MTLNARHGLILIVLACWDGWRLLAGRIADGASAAIILVLCGALALGWRRIKPGIVIPILPCAAILFAYAMATAFATPLVQIAIAAIAVIMVLHQALGLPQKGIAPLIGLTLFALPIMPTLDFFLAWPMRRISTLLTVAMVRSNGFSVSANGVALDWQGHLLLFDGPCSGIHMLRAALLLTSFLAIIARLGLWRYAATLGATAMLAIVSNAPRTASLFYLENGFLPQWQGPIMHEMVGLGSFVMLTAMLVWGMRMIDRREKELSPCA